MTGEVEFPRQPKNATKLQGVPISSTPPTDGQVLEYQSSSGEYEPKDAGGYTLPDDIEDGGSAEMNVGGLDGELADPQKQKLQNFGGDPLATQQTSYTTFYHFLFRGTTEMGTPTNIKVLLAELNSPTSVSVRIRDLTNGNTIAEQTGLTPSTYPSIDIQDMGALSNLPSGEAIFIVEALRTGGTFSPQVVLSGGEVQW